MHGKGLFTHRLQAHADAGNGQEQCQSLPERLHPKHRNTPSQHRDENDSKLILKCVKEIPTTTDILEILRLAELTMCSPWSAQSGARHTVRKRRPRIILALPPHQE